MAYRAGGIALLIGDRAARSRPNEPLEALRADVIGSYRAHLPGEPSRPAPYAAAWVKVVQSGQAPIALAQLGGEPARSPLANYLGRQPLQMAIGTMGPGGVIRLVSAEVTALLRGAPEQAVGPRRPGPGRNRSRGGPRMPGPGGQLAVGSRWLNTR
jgi:hypothetical protein